jgi:hypothetical protein
VEHILTAMTILLILVAVLVISALAVPFGADSRSLSDHTYDRDSLWSR